MEVRLIPQFKQKLIEEVKGLIKNLKQEMVMDLYHFNRSRIEDKHQLTDKLAVIKNDLNQLKNQNQQSVVKIMPKGKYELTDDALRISESRENQKLIRQAKQNLRTIEKRLDAVERRDHSTLRMKELSNEVLSLRRELEQKIAQFSENYVKLQSTMLDHRSKHLWRFQIKEKLIQLRCNEGSTHYQLLGRIPISKKSVNHFTVYSNWFECGIMDRKFIGQQNSWARKEVIFYTNEGWVRVSGKNQSKKQPIGYGTKLTMAVEDNRITWKANNKLKNSCLSAMIKSPHINWVPFIKLSQQGAKVLWE